MAPVVAARVTCSTKTGCNARREQHGTKQRVQLIKNLTAAIMSQGLAAKVVFADEVTFSPPQVTIPDSTVSAATDGGFGDIIADNPLLIGGVGLLLAVPVAINVIFKASSGGAGGVKLTNPAKAMEALEGDTRVILVDIRSKSEIKAQGKPDLKSIKRSAVSVPYTSLVKGDYVVDENFGEKVSKVRGVDEESIIILLDADGSESKDAAKMIQGVDKVYIVQGGAESWAAYGAWKEPGKGLSLSLPDLKGVGSSLNTLAEDFQEAPTLNKAGIALGALAGAGLFLVNEAEVLLEVAGLVAAGNFFVNLLFADSRKKTMDDIKEIVDEKVAVKEIGSDLNKIAAAIVDDSDTEMGEVAPEAQEAASAAAAAEETPAIASDNAKEAAEWIANWKAKNN